MENIFTNSEQIIADERFAGWYFKTDEQHISDWESYLSAHPHITPLVNEAISLMQQLGTEKNVGVERLQAAEKRLLYSIQQNNNKGILRKIRHARTAWIAAASVIIMLLAGAGYYWFSGKSASVKAAYGEIMEKVLPDGTRVLLNANSKITYAANWNEDSKREVWINGEAFFHVKKTQAKSRFVVHANQFDIIVTGTQFNVISKEFMNSVMLTEGSITLVAKNGQEMKLVPGDYAAFNNGVLEKCTATDESILAWRDRKLVFSAIPLRTAISLIEEHYGVTVKLKDSALGEKIMKGILPNDNLDVMLRSLEAAFQLKATRQGNVITISGH